MSLNIDKAWLTRVRGLVALDDLEAASAALVAHIDGGSAELRNEAVLITSRLASLRGRLRQGALTVEDAQRQRVVLSQAMLEFLDELARRAIPTMDLETSRAAYDPQPVKILFLGATPIDQVRLALVKEVREISRNLRESDAGRCFELVQEWAVRATDLSRLLLQHRPHIVHFSGHGHQTGELIFEDDAGQTNRVPLATLGKLFSVLGKGIQCVVLNACFSKPQAEEICAHVDCVVGTTDAIHDEAAIAFARSFYLALGHGESLRAAVELGCVEIELAGIHGTDVHELLCRPGVDAATLTFAPKDLGTAERVVKR